MTPFSSEAVRLREIGHDHGMQEYVQFLVIVLFFSFDRRGFNRRAPPSFQRIRERWVSFSSKANGAIRYYAMYH